VRAPLHAPVRHKPWTLRTSVNQPPRMTRPHVRRHFPLVRVRVATVATPEEASAHRKRLVYRKYRRRRLHVLMHFRFRYFAGQLCSLVIIRRRPVVGLRKHIIYLLFFCFIIVTFCPSNKDRFFIVKKLSCIKFVSGGALNSIHSLAH